MLIKHRTTFSRRTLLRSGAAAAAAAPFLMPRLGFADYSEGDVADGRRLTGRIKFDGQLPPDVQILISKDEHICGSGDIVSNPVEIGADGSLALAVVALNGIAAGKPWADAFAKPEIVQEKCLFAPYVQVAPKGADLTILNKDPLLHNIHAYELIGRVRRSIFNIAQPQADQVDTTKLKLRRGNVVEIDCDAHNWMSAWIYTSEHPYVAVTGADGAFSMDAVPPGNYEMTIWHPGVGSSTEKVEVAADDVDVEFALAPTEA